VTQAEALVAAQTALGPGAYAVRGGGLLVEVGALGHVYGLGLAWDEALARAVQATRPLVLLAPGSSAPARAGGMIARWARHLGALGEVRTFDYDGHGQVPGQPFRRTPCTKPEDVAALTRIHIAKAEALAPRSYLLAGKSMGAHIAAVAALALEKSERPPRAILALAYPLRAQQDHSIVRDAPLLALEKTPVFFIMGARDGLCRMDELEPVLAKMRVPTGTFVIPEMDHALDAPAHARIEGLERDLWEQKAAAAALDFVSGPSSG
jgi:predicted alpha/beta-hydrolase family hydrolase